MDRSHDPSASIDERGLRARVEQLPKVELHVHLEGSMQPSLLLELAEKHGVAGIPQTLAGVREWYEFRDFDHFIEVYQAAVHTLQEEDDFTRLVDQTAGTLAGQNVRYAEVIFTPHVHIVRGVDADEMFAGLERGQVRAREQHGLEIKWIPDFAGHYGVESGEITLDAIIHAGLDSIVGFNVGGLEVERDQFADVFRRARSVGLHSVPHAGEAGGPDRVWSAIRALGAERIGHGIQCMRDEALVDYLANEGIPLDVCPTSNVRTRIVSSLTDHPLPRMIERGLTVTLNTDDPPMFETDLNAEYMAALGMGLDFDTVVDLARNGVHASFAEDSQKVRILSEIDDFQNGASDDR